VVVAVVEALLEQRNVKVVAVEAAAHTQENFFLPRIWHRSKP